RARGLPARQRTDRLQPRRSAQAIPRPHLPTPAEHRLGLTREGTMMTTTPQRPTDRELLLQSFAEQGLNSTQAEAALAAMAPESWAAAARPAREAWADRIVEQRRREYEASPAGRLAVAEART